MKMAALSSKHLGDAVNKAVSPVIAATVAPSAAEALKGVKGAAAVAGVGVAAEAAAGATSATATASHADGVAHEAEAVARRGARCHAQGALEGGRDAQAEAGEQGGQGAAGDEGHDDHEEDLPGVALEPVYEVSDEALELLVRALHEALARGALVVRGARVAALLVSVNVVACGGGRGGAVTSKGEEAAARGVSEGHAKEGAARGIVLAVGGVLAKEVADEGASAAVTVAVTVAIAIAGVGAGAAALAGAMARGGATVVAGRGDREGVGEAGREEGHGVLGGPVWRMCVCVYTCGWINREEGGRASLQERPTSVDAPLSRVKSPMLQLATPETHRIGPLKEAGGEASLG